MAVITGRDDIFMIDVYDAKQGDIVSVLDDEGTARDVQLTRPVGERWVFKWVVKEAAPPQESDGRFVKPNDEWLVEAEDGHKPGDRLIIQTQSGPQEVRIKESVGDGLYRPVRSSHFILNPAGDKPKWCVRVYDADAKSGDVVSVVKSGAAPQKHKLVSEVKPGYWTTKKV